MYLPYFENLPDFMPDTNVLSLTLNTCNLLTWIVFENS
jgi:hypothetical protein